MMLPYESQELEYYNPKIRELAKKRGCSTWHTASIIEIKEAEIVFGMSKVMGRLVVKKSMLIFNES